MTTTDIVMDDLVSLIPDLKNYAALDNFLYSEPEELDVGKGTYALSTINDLIRFWDDNLRIYCLLSRSLCFTYDEVYKVFSIPFSLQGGLQVKLLPGSLKYALCFGSVKEMRDITRYENSGHEDKDDSEKRGGEEDSQLITPFMSGSDNDNDNDSDGNNSGGIAGLVQNFASLFTLFPNLPSRVKDDTLYSHNATCHYDITSVELLHNSSTPYISISLLFKIHALIIRYAQESDDVSIDEWGKVCVFEENVEADKLQHSMHQLSTSSNSNSNHTDNGSNTSSVEAGDEWILQEVYMGVYTFPDMIRRLVQWYRHKHPRHTTPTSPGVGQGGIGGGMQSPGSVHSGISMNSSNSKGRDREVDNDNCIVDILAQWSGVDTSTSTGSASIGDQVGSSDILVTGLCKLGLMERSRLGLYRSDSSDDNTGNDGGDEAILLITIHKPRKDTPSLSAASSDDNSHYHYLLLLHYSMLQTAHKFLKKQKRITTFQSSIITYGKKQQREKALKLLTQVRTDQSESQTIISRFNKLINMKDSVTASRLQRDTVRATATTTALLKQQRSELHATLQLSLSMVTGNGVGEGSKGRNNKQERDGCVDDIQEMITQLQDEYSEESGAVKEIESTLLGGGEGVEDVEDDEELEKELERLMLADQSTGESATATTGSDDVTTAADLPHAPSTAIVPTSPVREKEKKHAVAM